MKITSVIKSATSDITNAELTLVAKEIQKSCNQKVKYQKAVPETIKKEVGMNTKVYMGLRQLSKNFRPNFPSITSIGRRKTLRKLSAKLLTLLLTSLEDDLTLLKKVKDIAIGIRAACGVINRKQILNIAKGAVRANNPTALKEFGGQEV